MAGHVYGWLIFNLCGNKKTPRDSKGPHTIKHVRMNKNTLKKGRPKKENKRKPVSIYLSSDEKEKIINKFGSISLAIKSILLNLN